MCLHKPDWSKPKTLARYGYATKKQNNKIIIRNPAQSHPLSDRPTNHVQKITTQGSTTEPHLNPVGPNTSFVL